MCREGQWQSREVSYVLGFPLLVKRPHCYYAGESPTPQNLVEERFGSAPPTPTLASCTLLLPVLRIGATHGHLTKSQPHVTLNVQVICIIY